VDEIIHVLDTGCRYLDFPLDAKLKDFIVAASAGPSGEETSSLGLSPALG